MAIRKWHKGKLIILWAWGGMIGALSLTAFMADKVQSSPWAHLGEALLCLLVFLSLSAVTWHWLGDRTDEKASPEERKLSLEIKTEGEESEEPIAGEMQQG